MKVSIIIPVLNSHEVLRRQLLHWQKMGIPEDTEIIIVDDGSDPPLNCDGYGLPVTVHATNDFRPWTWALARNAGARLAKGEYLLMTDIDHFYQRNLLDYVRTFGGQKVQFLREFAVLNENGDFVQSEEVLLQYGLPAQRIKDRGFYCPNLPNNFAMRKDIFWEIGGYREDLVERIYPQGEDRLFKKAWSEYVDVGKGEVSVFRPTIYHFPNGQFCGDVDADPCGLFHKLTRKTHRNFRYKKQLREA